MASFKAEVSTGIITVYRIVQAIGKHVVAQHSLTGGSIGVGIEEAAPGGVIIAALEIIEPGFLGTLLAVELICDLSNNLKYQQIIPGRGPLNWPTLSCYGTITFQTKERRLNYAEHHLPCRWL